MARPLRLEFAGALYHVTSRGDGREDIYLSDDDRELWLRVLGEVCERFNWVCHAYCLMTNHYHVLIETPDANLSLGMRQLNGVYTQLFNKAHRRVGHVFQGRFKAILVDKDSYLLELARYIVLNPLRAKMIRSLNQWPWSSFAATCGQAELPPWLHVDAILSQFGKQRSRAIERYIEFVHDGRGLPSVWRDLQGQIFLGSDAFVEKMQSLIEKKPTISEIPKAQQRAKRRELKDFAESHPRNEAIAYAFLSGHHTMASIAEFFELHYTSVSRIVKTFEQAQRASA